MLELFNNMNLVFKNAKSKQGNVLPFEIKIPFNGAARLPDNILEGTIYDVQEESTPILSIYKGKICTVGEICKRNEGWFLLAKMSTFNQEDKLCYYEENYKKIVYAEVGQNDIVVKDVSEFKKELERISREFTQLQNQAIEQPQIKKQEDSKKLAFIKEFIKKAKN